MENWVKTLSEEDVYHSTSTHDFHGAKNILSSERNEARDKIYSEKVTWVLSNPYVFNLSVPPNKATSLLRWTFVFVAVVTQPSGRKAYPKIEDNKDGTVTIRYQPAEIGLHELAINYNNQPIQGESAASVWARLMPTSFKKQLIDNKNPYVKKMKTFS